MTPPAAIEARSLSKSYKNVSVLKDVSFSVQKGTVFALLGSNGAGKTTTINILTTLIKADGGTATVAGHDVAARPDKVLKAISLTGQFAAVDDRLTGRENLLLIGDLRHVADSAKTANGDVRLSEIASGVVHAQTACGKVDIGVLDGVAAWLDLYTQYGNVRNDLNAAERSEPGEATVEVRARSSFGDITVRRSSPLANGPGRAEA